MSDHPVQVVIPPDDGQNRLWGIPLLGVIVRSFLIIPHAIILIFVAIALYLFLFVNWIPILLFGRMGGLGYAIAGGYLRLGLRTGMYVALINGRYPPFGLSGDHPIQVSFDQTETQNRLWGIPLLGVFARGILLIPHFIVLWFLGLVAALVLLFSWLPILINGRQADSVVQLVGGIYRWGTRVTAYLLLLTGRYPPFRFD